MPTLHSIEQAWGRSALIYTVIALFGAAFIYESYQTALLQHQGGMGFFLLHLSFSLPEVLIWLLATVGALRFKNYAMSIKTSSDGSALDYIANALLLLVLYVVLVSLGGTITDVAANTRFERLTINLVSHAPLAVILLSAILLWTGSKQLLKLIDYKPQVAWFPSLRFCVTVVIFVSFSLIFTLNFYHFADSVQKSEDIMRFALEPHMLLLTYVLPHLITWLLGLLACVNLGKYAHQVSGVIYKQLFRDLQRGVVVVFVSTFLAQVLISTLTTDDDMSIVLLTVYAVLLLCLWGFYLVYRGTKQLERLEQ